MGCFSFEDTGDISVVSRRRLEMRTAREIPRITVQSKVLSLRDTNFRARVHRGKG